TQTSAATDGQRVDTKIPVIQSGSGSDDTNCAQIQSIDECLNDSQRTDDKEAAVDQTSQDVHMKSAESLECLSTKSGAEVAAAAQVSDTTSACASASDAATVAADDNEDESSQPSTSEEIVKLKIVFNKTTHDIEIGLKRTGHELKEKLQTLIKVDPSMQKLVVKGIPIQDNKTLSESNIKNGFKVLCVGSTLQEVLD
ncbi:unnamed protein product, partial [Oppiella nova]